VLSQAQADRQGRISRLAFTALGGPDAIAFLNAEHATLGARPLDLAIASDEGYTAVAEALSGLSAEE
jgi:hypothetical protein